MCCALFSTHGASAAEIADPIVAKSQESRSTRVPEKLSMRATEDLQVPGLEWSPG